MARHQHLLPRAELAVGLAQQPLGLGLQPPNLVGDVEIAVIAEMAQLLDLGFQLGDWLFEIEEGPHSHPSA